LFEIAIGGSHPIHANNNNVDTGVLIKTIEEMTAYIEEKCYRAGSNTDIPLLLEMPFTQLPIMSIDYFSNVLITIELRIVYSIASSVSGCYYCSNRYKFLH